MRNLAIRFISWAGGFNRLFIAYTIITASVMVATILFNHFFPHTTFGLVLMVVCLIMAVDLVISLIFYAVLYYIGKSREKELDY